MHGKNVRRCVWYFMCIFAPLYVIAYFKDGWKRIEKGSNGSFHFIVDFAYINKKWYRPSTIAYRIRIYGLIKQT